MDCNWRYRAIIGLFCATHFVLVKNFVDSVKYESEIQNSDESANEHANDNEIRAEKNIIRNKSFGTFKNIDSHDNTHGKITINSVGDDYRGDVERGKAKSRRYTANGGNETEEIIENSLAGMCAKADEKGRDERIDGLNNDTRFQIFFKSTLNFRNCFKDLFKWFCAYLINGQNMGANESIKIISRSSTTRASHVTTRSCESKDAYCLENYTHEIFKFHRLSQEQIERFIETYTSFYNDHAPEHSIIDKLFLRTPSRIKERHAHLAALRTLNIRNIKRRDRYAFVPILQCTEIISVILSVLSLFNTVIAYHTRIRGRKTPLHNLYTTQYYISCVTWVGSILLHIDDNRFTRFCDYFSALLGIMYYFYTATVRLLLSFKVSNVKEITTHLFNLLALVYISVVHHNVSNFDPKALKFVSGIFVLLFLAAILVQSVFFHNKFIKYVVFFTIIGLMVESSDIEPFCFVLDSHAIWHFFIGIQNFYYNRYLEEEISLMGGGR